MSFGWVLQLSMQTYQSHKASAAIVQNRYVYDASSCLFLVLLGLVSKLQKNPTMKMKWKQRKLACIASSCDRYKWNPSIGTATEMSVDSFDHHRSSLHSLFSLLTTSPATVDFPEPGGPAKPTMYLSTCSRQLLSVWGTVNCLQMSCHFEQSFSWTVDCYAHRYNSRSQGLLKKDHQVSTNHKSLRTGAEHWPRNPYRGRALAQKVRQ